MSNRPMKRYVCWFCRGDGEVMEFDEVTDRYVPVPCDFCAGKGLDAHIWAGDVIPPIVDVKGEPNVPNRETV